MSGDGRFDTGLARLISSHSGANVKDSTLAPRKLKRQFQDGPTLRDPRPCTNGKKHVCCYPGSNWCVEFVLFPNHRLCLGLFGWAALVDTFDDCCGRVEYKPFIYGDGSSEDPDTSDVAIGKAYDCDKITEVNGWEKKKPGQERLQLPEVPEIPWGDLGYPLELPSAGSAAAFLKWLWGN